jgi:hypothetical protein
VISPEAIELSALFPFGLQDRARNDIFSAEQGSPLMQTQGRKNSVPIVSSKIESPLGLPRPASFFEQ